MITRERIIAGRREYVTWFHGCRRVLDLGSGGGEFLELLREAGITASGIDRDPDRVAACRARGFEVVAAELEAALAGMPAAGCDGMMAAHIIEHFPPEGAERIVAAAARILAPNGVLVIVTPNPDDHWMATTGFWQDPEHRQFYPLPVLTDLLTRHKLTLVASGIGTGARYNDRQARIRRLYNRLLNLVVGPHWNQGDRFIVGRKP